MTQFNFDGIGTSWQIDIYQEVSKEKEAEILLRVRARIEIFDKNYSRFREDSLVTAMSKTAGVFALPIDAKPLLALYQDLYKITGGLFTPLVGDILSAAGYDEKYSLRQKKSSKERISGKR